MSTGGNITPRVLAEHQYNCKQHFIATNSNYFSPAFTGIAFTFGAYMFAYQLLAKHSTGDPRGFLTPEIFESFFGYMRDTNNRLVFTYVSEHFPDNWYKCAPEDALTLTGVLISTAQQCISYPSNYQIGWSTGEVNSFSEVDL